MSNLTTVKVNVGGIDLEFESGKIGKQANGCVFARMLLERFLEDS